jgi:glycosyltransferase involved in cell wall biosynthesis
MLGFDRQKVVQEETRLVEAVDIVFTTSRPLYEQKIKYNPNTYLMPNVADVDLFGPVASGAIRPAPEVAALPHPIVGFIGAIDAYKVNLGLLTEVAQLLPAWSFVLIGPVGLGDHTQAERLPDTPNLHFLGPRAYSSLPAYMAAFDVCVIPYQINSYTAGVFPLKFWEYLAAGKPVVTTPLPSLSDYYPYVEVAAVPGDFAEALQRALATAKDAIAIQKRIALATGHSWKARAAEMVQVLASHLKT